VSDARILPSCLRPRAERTRGAHLGILKQVKRNGWIPLGPLGDCAYEGLRGATVIEGDSITTIDGDWPAGRASGAG
jgi:hypothetical protein